MRDSIENEFIWCSYTGKAIHRVGVAIDVGVVPEAVGGKHHYVRQVPNAIMGVSKDALSSWLFLATAGAVGARVDVRACGAIAGSSTACGWVV